jgi:hypothetical protein
MSRLVEQICQGSGAPCEKFKVPAREQKEFVLLLAPMRKEIVERQSDTFLKRL